MIVVKIGDKYWIVIAEASGICCSVRKKRNKAVVPNSPLSSKYR
jgi:hypothetical protein